MAAFPIAVRLYSIVSGLVLPANFRRQYGRAMVDAFHDLCRETPSRANRPPWTIAREFGLLIGTAVSVRVEMRRDRKRKKRLRGLRRGDWGVSGLTRDHRHAMRAIRRQPGFAMFAIVPRLPDRRLTAD